MLQRLPFFPWNGDGESLTHTGSGQAKCVETWKLYNLYRSTTCIHVDLSFAKLAFYIDMFSILFLRELKVDATYVLEKFCYFKCVVH